MSFTATYYRGHDLLTEMPNAREDRDQAMRTESDVFDNAVGQVAIARVWGSPVLDHPFLWYFEERSRLNDFLWWCALRRGKYAPLWVPTWRQDLLLADAIAADATALVVRATGYTALHFPSEARRHLVAIVAGGGAITLYPRRVTEAVDNEDGTETLTIEEPFGVALDADAMLSFLVLARLADDEVTIQWELPSGVAEAQTRFVELPRQVAT
jgi:hypothetical protein